MYSTCCTDALMHTPLSVSHLIASTFSWATQFCGYLAHYAYVTLLRSTSP